MSETIKSYKGFDKDLKCRGFQYEVGKEYEMEGPVKACQSGFHACEAPIDVLAYYAPATSRYCEVEQSGETSRDGKDTKVASSKIKIGAEIGIPGLVKAQIEWVKTKTHEEKGGHATGDYGAASATGGRGAASATGYQGAASATGKDGVAMACGFAGKVRGSIGNAMFLVERGKWNGETFPILNVAAFVIDGEKYRPNTWYTLVNGKIVESEE